MNRREADLGRLVADLLRAAVRADGRRQFHISKTLRAVAASLVRRAAAERGYPRDTRRLVGDLVGLATRVRSAGLGDAVGERLEWAAETIARGGLADIERFPDQHVCRLCGALAERGPPSHCPGCGAHGLTFRRLRCAYWISEWLPPAVLERLERNPGLFAEALEAIAPEKRDWTASAGTWTATDVLRHVRDANGLFRDRVALILSQEEPRLVAKATYVWTDTEPTAAESIMETYRTSRCETVERLRTIAPADWQRTGTHPAMGVVTLAELSSFFAAHELTHLRRLEEIRRVPDAG